MNYYTRNSNLNYYIEHCEQANCGSFALRINEWYDLDTPFENYTGMPIESWINKGVFENDSTDLEMSELYAAILVGRILDDFEEDIRLIDSSSEVKSNEELIAFRAYIHYDESVGYTDWDYHFKVYRDGHWQEKNGDCEVHDCDEDDWGDYVSDTYYFAKNLS